MEKMGIIILKIISNGKHEEGRAVPTPLRPNFPYFPQQFITRQPRYTMLTPRLPFHLPLQHLEASPSQRVRVKKGIQF
jgi:hypothetical protein